jgi:shikimate dehydrogenase
MYKKNIYGLIGKNIPYSFSKKIFTKKFKKENLKKNFYYIFDIKNIFFLKKILYNNSFIKGLNVTIPYKESIIPFLYDLSLESKKIGAVNTIVPTKLGYIGYNTDIYGFEHSFIKNIKKFHKRALILGTGGAAKSVFFVLNKLGIKSKFVSRKKKKNNLSYKEINFFLLKKYKIIINCTPIGSYPEIKKFPLIPYKYLNYKHYLYDLIYNPIETSFLKKGKKMGCFIKNGLEMLYLQAKKSWKIWNK